MSNGTSPILEAKHLGISFGGLKAVSDFNLEIAPGELVGLIGPNGAGKTTVFNLLTGVYKPTSGSIKFEGREWEAISRQALPPRFQKRRSSAPAAKTASVFRTHTS